MDDGVFAGGCGRRRGECALDAQDTISGLAGGGPRGLDFRIGIGAGRAVLLDLGGFRGRRQFVVAGLPWRQWGRRWWMWIRERSPSAARSPAYWLRATSSRPPRACSGYWRSSLNLRIYPRCNHCGSKGTCRTQSRPTCPRVLEEFLDEDEAAWHTEYLTTTSLFLNMRGLDLTDARDRNALQLVVRTAQEIFDRYEGTLTGILADDKALTLLGAFGLPPLVHEEDALHAVAAGQALDRALLDIRLDHGIGITTGRVFTGLYGTDVFRARAVVGPSVNMAARLMQAAGNEVLCDRATRRATRGRVHFAPLRADPSQGARSIR